MTEATIMSDVEKEVRAIIDEVQRDLGVGEEVFIGAGYSFGDALVERFAAALASSRQEVERLARAQAEAIERAVEAVAVEHAKDLTAVIREMTQREGAAKAAITTLQQQVAQVVQEMREGLNAAYAANLGKNPIVEGWVDTLSSSLPDQD